MVLDYWNDSQIDVAVNALGASETVFRSTWSTSVRSDLLSKG
jgi:hypothetical protein